MTSLDDPDFEANSVNTSRLKCGKDVSDVFNWHVLAIKENDVKMIVPTLMPKLNYMISLLELVIKF